MLNYILRCLDCGVVTGPTQANQVIYDLAELSCRECHSKHLRLEVYGDSAPARQWENRAVVTGRSEPVWTPPIPRDLPAYEPLPEEFTPYDYRREKP